ncbi:hypothetical protein GCK72_016787 [Caenorhabditis remanei]|uniref:Uncharacterized protein n=1 Tax=Caenorhabditis remanei TaxID=31234 RepID=A0A6A5G5K2_CAERE|nr:hypothetical protein GCK72_016787 [Caenorhabditis remanei]KAF1750240.1 hypothetical protein GCK72_016787 [Caenorhabditis remanei]
MVRLERKTEGRNSRCFNDALDKFETAVAEYEEGYDEYRVSPENSFLRTFNLANAFSFFLRTHNFYYCQGHSHFNPVVHRNAVNYAQENLEIFNTSQKLVTSGIIDNTMRSLRVAEGLPMLTDDSAAHIINYSLTDSKKEANKTITLANEDFYFTVKKSRIYGSSLTNSIRTIVLPQSIVVLVYRGTLDKKEWAGIHKVIKRIRKEEE